LNKQPKYIETIILSERGERHDNLCLFHISTNIETLRGCQGEGGWFNAAQGTHGLS
jgi:hypothetical protein